MNARSPDTLQQQLSKKGKNARQAANAFLADQSNLNLEALGKPELITKLNSCITLLREQCEISDATEEEYDNSESVLIEEIDQLTAELSQTKTERDCNLGKLQAEITSLKVTVADRALEAFLSAQTKPSYADVAREGTASVVVADYADGRKPNQPLSVSALETLLNSETTGLIPHRVRHRDNQEFITFDDAADAARAAKLFQDNPKFKDMFKGVRKIESLHPVVILFAEVSDLDALRQELEHRNKTFRGQIHDIKTIFRKQGTNLGHVKILLKSERAKKAALDKKRAAFFDESLRIVDIDLNREVRRCFKCQGYGHTQMICRAQHPKCGKCSGSHRTSECPVPDNDPICANCGGPHQAGHRGCPEQVRAVARYREFLNRKW
jgi:phosphotransferase system IIB component